MITNCQGIEARLDAQTELVEARIMPDFIVSCVDCGSGRIEANDDNNSVYCHDCEGVNETVDHIADAELPRELAKIWANAPVIEPPAYITTQVYQFTFQQEEAA